MSSTEKNIHEPDTYPLFMGPLPPKFVKKAEDELFETPENREICIKKIKALLKKENMKEHWFSDEVLTMYLRSKKFDVQRTFSSMERMVKFIQKNTEYFERPDPNLVDKVVKKEIFNILPQRDNDGALLVQVKLGRWDPSEISPKDVIKIGMVILIHCINEPMTQVNGCKIIYDFKCNPLRYLRYISPMHVYICYQLTLECVPIRIKGFHIINPSVMSKFFFTLVHPLLSAKLKKRMFIHDDSKKLLSFISAKAIPAEYGGQLPTEEITEAWVKGVSLPDYMDAIFRWTKESQRVK